MPLRPTRVLVVNDSLAVGGAEQVAVDVANGLDRDRYRVSFCSTRSDGPLRDQLRPDVETTVLGRRATWDLAKLATFGALVRRQRIDVVHSHGRGTMKFVALARAAGLVDARHVFHDHFNWLHVDRRAGPALRRSLATVDAYLGVDARLCQWATTTAGLSPSRVHLLRSGVDIDRFAAARPAALRSELDVPDGAVVCAMVGNLRPQKDHPTLFRAMAALTPEVRDRLRVAICGSADADRSYTAGCAAMIERLVLGGHVHLLGVRSDTPAVLAAADAGILSSKNETGPLVVLEYMASGLPFVATDTGEITHAIRDLDVGLVPAPRDHREMAEALEVLVALSPAERAAMGVRGRRVAAERFSRQAMVSRLERIYEAVLGLRVAA